MRTTKCRSTQGRSEDAWGAAGDLAGALDVAGSPGHHILRGLYGAVILGAGKIIVCRSNLKEETMPDRILTSHAGSLPRPEDLIALNAQRAAGELANEAEYLGGCARRSRTSSRASATPASTSSTTASTGTRWASATTTAPGGPTCSSGWAASSWPSRLLEHRAGAAPAGRDHARQLRRAPGLAARSPRPTATRASGVALPNRRDRSPRSAAGRSPTSGRRRSQRDIADIKAAMDAAGIADGFLNSVAPGSCARFGNEYYADDEELL